MFRFAVLSVLVIAVACSGCQDGSVLPLFQQGPVCCAPNRADFPPPWDRPPGWGRPQGPDTEATPAPETPPAKAPQPQPRGD
jgi:hypothetical protein